MSILRKLMVTGLAAGAVIAAPSAALASAAPPAHQASAAVDKIHQVRCQSLTFNVYHGTPTRETCYEGLGRITPDIRNVHEITTGENDGYFEIQTGHGTVIVRFLPRETFRFTGIAELIVLDIAST